MGAGFREIWRRVFTPSGGRFLILTLGVGFAAVNTGNNLLYLVLAMLLALIIASGILARQTLRGVTLERRTKLPVHAGDPFLIRYRVTNRKRWLPAFSLTIEEAIPGSAPVKSYLFHVPPKTTEAVETPPRVFSRRGGYSLSNVHIRTSFPFGFFYKRVEFFQEKSFLVYPRLAALPGGVGSPATLGSLRSRQTKRVRGVELRNLREYVPGEDARTIHWKASARAGRLLAKEFEQEEGQRIWVMLSNRRPQSDSATGASIGPEEREAFERSVSLAASICRDGISDGYEVGLWSHSDLVPRAGGANHLDRLFQTLALVEPIPAESQPNESQIVSCLEGGAVLILPWHDASWDRLRLGPAQRLEMSAPNLRNWPSRHDRSGGEE